MPAEKKSVEAIFSGALAKRTTAERAAYLDGACGNDARLRARVEELLQAHQAAGSFLSSPPTGVAPASPVGEGPGTRLGQYKLLQLIGEGGFGVVYMAEQEEPVQRKVALKIIKLGMDTKQVIARFEAERQALAMMDHPNIAKVLAAGATETGRPYFVMELVRGVPITEYCDKNNLTTRERLALFLPVCHAIQHAHQKGIIHRDVKPTNVMVTLHDGRPVPKVIDFGIAKATNRRLTERTLFTEYRQFIGTPEYMSPEQAEMSGLDIDTRSDVYSLGVLLYELLTGTTPFDPQELRSAGYVEITRIIREEDPPTPSTRLSMLGDRVAEIARHRRVEPGALGRLLRGDLDWIVMKALDKDRTRRYETASSFASDIERHLTHEPVLAGPPSATYKLMKFVRRNRRVVLAGSLVAAALLVGLTLATVGLLQARRDRKLAIEEAERSRAIIESLQETLAAVDPERLADLDPDARNVLAIAREVVTEAAPLPVSFGKYAHLDAYRGANWMHLAEAVERMNKDILKLVEKHAAGYGGDPQLERRVQEENRVLARVASGLLGQIPTHSPINGEFTHPLGLINLRVALLERAERPLTALQKALIAQAGRDYELAFERRQSTYTADTPRIEKMTDELELKRDCMVRVADILTPEQREVLVTPEIHNRAQLDVLSPISMVILLVEARGYSSKERVRALYPSNLASRYEVESKKLESHEEFFDSWHEEVAPLLETVTEERIPVHLDEAITAGRAQANLLKKLLTLPDLDEKTRIAMLNDRGWRVPRVVCRPLAEVRKSIEKLRDTSGPADTRLAEELAVLGRLLGEDEQVVEAIPAVMEAIEINRKALGESWNCDPLRYQLRGLVWRIALDPAQPRESYKVALRGAELVLALKPESAYSMKTLGVVQYRLGLHEDALATLSRADEIHSERYPGGVPADVAYLAMTQFRLGRMAEARASLARLRELMRSSTHCESPENRKMLTEAEALFESAEPEAPEADASSS